MNKQLNKKETLLLCCIISILSGCYPKKPLINIPSKSNFTSFEVSFINMRDSLKMMSFSVDTSKIYFAKTSVDSLRFGLLPDTLFRLINDKTIQLIQEKLVRSNDVVYCGNCVKTSIFYIIKNDTIRIFKNVTPTDTALNTLITSIDKYLKSNPSSKTIKYQDIECFETMEKLIPPPPPPKQIGDVRFQSR